MASIFTCILLFTLITVENFVFTVSQLSDNNIISDLQFGTLNTFLETNGHVHHLDEDLYVPGNILYSEGDMLKTTDGKTVHLIVGSGQGYREGKSQQALFYWLIGFLQINSTHVLVVDSGNHCLRFVNRLNNQTSLFVGGFQGTYSLGFRDGFYSDARFYRPFSVVNDVNNLHTVIVADRDNKALRSVTLKSGEVKTLVHSLPGNPYKAVFSANNDEMLVILRNSLGRFNIKTSAFRTLTSTSKQGLDGDFTIGSFVNAVSILRINEEIQLVADSDSNKLRIVDMKRRTIASICDGTSQSVDGPISNCSLNAPFGFLLKSDTLYIAEYQHIRSIPVKTFTPCNNIIVKLSASEQEKCLEIIPGRITCYPPGSHHYKIPERNCSIVITITKDVRNTTCPYGIYEVADAITMKAKVRLPDGHYMTLSIGEHIYHSQSSDNMTCDISVHVADPRLNKRLDISANYQLSCPLLNDLKTIILSVAKMRYRQIQFISSGYCNQSAVLDVMTSCKNDVLNVLWPTDCVFQTNSVKEQDKVVAAVKEYLKKNKGPTLELVIPSHIPPIIEPIIDHEGLPFTLSMTPFCLGDLKYSNTTQRCL